MVKYRLRVFILCWVLSVGADKEWVMGRVALLSRGLSSGCIVRCGFFGFVESRIIL